MKRDDEDDNKPDLKTAQDAGAPQDENPGGASEVDRNKPGAFTTKKRKPKVKAGAKDKDNKKLLNDDAKIDDETTI